MNKLFSRQLDDADDKKKYLYNNSKRHFKSLRSSPSSFSSSIPQLRKRRSLLSVKGIVSIIIVVVIIFFLYQLTHKQHNTQHITLKDQPIYKKHKGTCSAVLCNPTNKCSTWKPNHQYNWTDLSKAGLFRDLSTIQLDLGCVLKIKIEEGIDEGKWVTIPEGFTKCTELGYGINCRNFVQMDLQG